MDEFGSLFDEIPVPEAPTPVQAQRREAAAEWSFGDDLPYNWSPGVVFAGPNAEHPGLDHTMTPGFDDHLPPPETIDDDPEAALPVTYGEDETEVLAARVAAALAQPSAHQHHIVPRVATGNHSHAVTAQPQHLAGFPLCAKGCNNTLSAGMGLINTAGGLAHAECPTGTTAAVESEEERGRRLLAYADALARGETPPGPNPFGHLLASQSDDDIAAAAAQYLATKAPESIRAEALKRYDPQERQAIIDEGIEVRAGNLDRLDISGTHYEALEASAGRAVPEDEDLTFLSGDPNDF